MKLKALYCVKDQTPSRSVVETIMKLVPNGKVPKKGTIRREALEEAVMQELYVKPNDTKENPPSKTLEDSDDLVSFIEFRPVDF